MLIGIDNGHGKETAGKRVPDGSMREWEFNYSVAKYLKKELEHNGFKTLMLSDTEVDTPLATRSSKANKEKVDICVSIHANALRDRFPKVGESVPKGIETFAYSKGSKGDKLANFVQDELIKSTGLTNRGVKYSNLHMTRQTDMPSILVECGFMDNPDEVKLLKSDEYRKKCAIAITKGICQYFGVVYKEIVEVKPQPKVEVKQDDILFRVITGSYQDRALAQKQVEELKKKGIDSFIAIYKK